MTDVDRHLGRTRTRYEIRGSEHVKEFFTRDPSAAADEFLLHHGDMSGRPPKGGQPQAQKWRGQITNRVAQGGRHLRPTVPAILLLRLPWQKWFKGKSDRRGVEQSNGAF